MGNAERFWSLHLLEYCFHLKQKVNKNFKKRNIINSCRKKTCYVQMLKTALSIFTTPASFLPSQTFSAIYQCCKKREILFHWFFFDARTGSITSECLMFWQSSSKSLSTGRNTHATNTILHEKNLFIWNAFFFWWTKSIRFLKQYNLLNQISAWIILNILKPFYIASHKNP